MITISNYGSQDVKCPFYIREENTDLICEGAINKYCIHHFKSNRQKQEHKEKFCNTFDYKNCIYFKGIFSLYKPYKFEMPGTFPGHILERYKQI